MPSLSKLIALPAALCVAACLAVGPGVGQEKEPTLKTTDQPVIKIEPLDPRLGPGNVLDQDMAGPLISKIKPTNSWHKVPSWVAVQWQPTKMVYLTRDEKTGKEESKDYPNIDIAGISQMFGQYLDKQGQAWEHDLSFGWWQDPLDSSTTGYETVYKTMPKKMHKPHIMHGYEIMPKPPIITDTECTRLGESTNFYIDPATGKISFVVRDRDETSIKLVSPGKSRSTMIMRLFDLQGNHISTTEATLELNKIGNFAAPQNQIDQDGKPLYPLFVQFLKDHGMADRIPDAPPEAPGAVAKP